MSPTRQPKGLRFGEKVYVALRRNAEAGIEPSNAKALADAIHEDNPKVYRALKAHNPKLDIAQKIARALGESLDFLCDPSKGYDAREPGERWERFVASLSPTERDAIAASVSRPDVKRLLLGAFGDRGQSGPFGPNTTPR